MEGYLWLLLQTLPLLTVAAVGSFILGFRWRLPAVKAQPISPTVPVPVSSTSTESEEKLRLTLTQTESSLRESQESEAQLQREILRLSDALKSANADVPSALQLVQLQETHTILQTEVTRLEAELEQAQKTASPAKKAKAKKAAKKKSNK